MLGLLTLDWHALHDWQSTPQDFTRDDFLRLRASGVNVFHPAVEPDQADAYAACRQWIDGWNRLLPSRPDAFVRIAAAADLPRAKAEGKVGVLIGFQNSDHFRTAADVALFQGLGQRVSQLTYNAPNRIGGGCLAGGAGLTPDRAIEGILGGNFQRALTGIWGTEGQTVDSPGADVLHI